jgi:hypothetical protein
MFVLQVWRIIGWLSEGKDTWNCVGDVGGHKWSMLHSAGSVEYAVFEPRFWNLQ